MPSSSSDFPAPMGANKATGGQALLRADRIKVSAFDVIEITHN